MDSLIYASVRQVASTWYCIALTQNRAHEDACDVGLMQAEIYLSDLGIVNAAAAPYLEGARRAIAGVMQGRVQNQPPRGPETRARCRHHPVPLPVKC